MRACSSEAGVDDPGDRRRLFRGRPAKLDAEELAIVYGHPERRLGRMPEVLAITVPDGRQRALGLAHQFFGAGAMVAMAV